MSVTRTFTVTVVSTGSGNKYFIDGVQQATLNIAEGGIYKFDQSDSSNSNHPLRFSTTSDGTHNSGSEYTTGVTSSGTPGDAGAYTQITVAPSAPTLYYYCTNHSGMGGQANTPASNTWGLFAWNDGEYAAQGNNSVTLTGVSSTTSLGVPIVGAEQGWGRDEWGEEPWGDSFSPTISVTAPAALTSTLGQLAYAQSEEGWGRDEWGNSGWGVDFSVSLTGLGLTSSVGSVIAEEFVTAALTGVSTTSSVGNPVTEQLTFVNLTGLQAQTELGDFDNAGTLVGWGRNGWGEEPYGDSFNKLVQLAGLSSTASEGAIAPADVIGITGVSSTASVGAIAPADVMGLTGVSSTASVGSIVSGIGVPLTGVSSTSSVGAIAPADVMGLTGVSATSAVGVSTIDNTEIISLSGVGATSSVGSIVPEIGVPLTGVSLTASTGTISPTEMSIGLTGLELQSTVNASGIAFPGVYEILTPKTSTGYTTKTPKTSTGYTIKTPA